MPRRLIALLLLFAVGLSGCGGVTETISDKVVSVLVQNNAEEAADEEISSFGLEYNANESLNPIMTKSRANSYLLRAVYDCLISLDSAFMPTPALCKSWTGDGRTFTLVLRQGVRFHDGSPFGSADVVYTLNFIKSHSDSPYYKRLADMKSVTAVDDSTVMIQLERPNILFVSNLEIPIVKANSIGKGEYEPNGTGPYRFSGPDRLTAFDGYWNRPQSQGVKEILLFDTPNDDVQFYNFESGNVSLQYVSLADSTKTGAYGAFSQKELATPQLVYLAPNRRKGQLSDGNVCKALSILIDRQEIIDSALAKHAKQAVIPLPPDWGMLKGYKPGTGNKSDATALLSGKRLTFTLLVNSENQFKVGAANELSRMLKAYGIELNVNSVPWSEFNDSIKRGNYDFYLGETKLPPDMDISYLVGTGGSHNFTGMGYPALDEAIAALRGAENYDQAASAAVDLCDAFVEAMPIIPLYFSNAAIIYKEGFEPPGNCTDSNPYGDIQLWKRATSND